jgi:hypothetical protein
LEKLREERFLRAKGARRGSGLSAQADRLAGARREEKSSACFVRNDGWMAALGKGGIRNQEWRLGKAKLEIGNRKSEDARYK